MGKHRQKYANMRQAHIEMQKIVKAESLKCNDLQNTSLGLLDMILSTCKTKLRLQDETIQMQA